MKGMDGLIHHNARPAIALGGTAATGISLGAVALVLGASWLVIAPGLGVGVLALIALRGAPIGRSMLNGDTWIIRYGRQCHEVRLSEVLAVTQEAGGRGGDTLFVELRDGRVLPLPDTALPPHDALEHALAQRGVEMRCFG